MPRPTYHHSTRGGGCWSCAPEAATTACFHDALTRNWRSRNCYYIQRLSLQDGHHHVQVCGSEALVTCLARSELGHQRDSKSVRHHAQGGFTGCRALVMSAAAPCNMLYAFMHAKVLSVGGGGGAAAAPVPAAAATPARTVNVIVTVTAEHVHILATGSDRLGICRRQAVGAICDCCGSDLTVRSIYTRSRLVKVKDQQPCTATTHRAASAGP